MPFGATYGFVAVTLGFILKEQGLDDADIGILVAMNVLPHTWKFFYAPITDVTLSRKTWYILANSAACTTILCMLFVPIDKGNLGTLEVLILINSVAISLLGMAVEGLMAYATPPDHRGRAAGWFQAGNLGGAGIGGGLALLIAENTTMELSIIATAAMFAACMLGLFFCPNAPRIHVDGSFGKRVVGSTVEVAKDLWGVIASRRGIVALVLCFLPIGSGAASGLFAAIAKRWGADAELVALITGTLGGVVSAVGCLVGGWMSDRMRRAIAYAVSGLMLAIVALGMALLPHDVAMYVVFTLLYQFATGIAFACFTGFVLEIIGSGAAATKYNAFASLSNIPITYMTVVAGWASTNHGPTNMLLVDAGSEIAGIAVLLLVIALVRPGRTVVPSGVTTEAALRADEQTPGPGR
jgi:MFS family permease